MRANTSGSSRPPSRPKPPWQRQIAASNSASYAEVAHVELHELGRQRLGGRRVPRELHELRRVVDAHHVDPARARASA